MRYDAKELRYEVVEVFGKRVLFSDDRIIRDSVPKDFSLYEVRYDDENIGYPVEIAKGILVNFYGTLLIENGLPEVEENGRILIENGDWKYIGENTCTLEEYFMQQNGKPTEQYVPLVRMSMAREREVPYASEIANNPEKVAELAKRILEGADRECILVLSMDSKGSPLAIEIVSIGIVNAAISEAREIFKHSILAGAAWIVMIHNHISGDCTPSEADIRMTEKICKAGKLLGIPVKDHVIIGDGYYSFRNAMLLEES